MIAIKEMISVKKPVIFDCVVDQTAKLLSDDPFRRSA